MKKNSSKISKRYKSKNKKTNSKTKKNINKQSGGGDFPHRCGICWTEYYWDREGKPPNGIFNEADTKKEHPDAIGIHDISLTELPCNHIFHKECLKESEFKFCPFCGLKFNGENLQDVGTQDKMSSKTLIEKLKSQKKNDKKFVIPEWANEEERRGLQFLFGPEADARRLAQIAAYEASPEGIRERERTFAENMAKRYRRNGRNERYQSTENREKEWERLDNAGLTPRY